MKYDIIYTDEQSKKGAYYETIRNQKGRTV